jgi:Tol biopolymer transport system component
VYRAFVARHPVDVRVQANRLGIALAAALVVGAVALSPAGAKVADLVRDAVEPGSENAQPALTSLPTRGRVLVDSPQGPWIVSRDGSQRLLGAYGEAAWSPNGLFVAVARGRNLTAVDPVGAVRWSLAAEQPVSNPAWSTSGSPVAYTSGDSLRVVDAVGTGDRRLAEHVAPVTPVWRPLSEPVPAGQVAVGPGTNVLAYVDRRGQVTVRDVDSRRVLWRTHGYGAPIRGLEWSADRQRLLVRTISAVDFYDARGRIQSRVKWSTLGATMSPDGKRTAFIRRTGGGRTDLVITGRFGDGPPRHVLSRPGWITDPTWSPNGEWLLVARRGADEWLFVRPSRRVEVEAVANVARQFAPGASGQPLFPRVSGWCCAR